MRTLLLLPLLWLSAFAAAPLKPAAGQRVLVLGDSITYGGSYVTDLETHWILSLPGGAPEVLNLGLSSETACGLSEPGHLKHGFPRPDLHERLGRVLEQVKPQVVLACYGMNDGLQEPFDEGRFAAFQDGIRRLRDAVTKSGARIVHLTPPVYDGPYDEVLDRYGKWLLERRADGWEVVDLHGLMKQRLLEARRDNPAFTYSRDKVHPDGAGHRVMAESVARYFDADDGAAWNASLGKPAFAPLRAKVNERMTLWRDAWLTQTGHKRPGVARGKPMPEAKAAAAKLDEAIAALAQ